jgi:HNH endonuclease
MNIATQSVRVYNASYQELSPTTLDRAMVLVELQGRAEVIMVDENTIIRTRGGREYFLPKIIRLIQMIKVPFYYAPAHWSREGVMERDKHTCGYCGKTKAQHGITLTHDHILPKSRGGDESWENSIAACIPCNGKKADRTPQEANMPLLWEPTVPKRKYFKSDKPRRRRKNS